jgi:hypothetical protein
MRHPPEGRVVAPERGISDPPRRSSARRHARRVAGLRSPRPVPSSMALLYPRAQCLRRRRAHQRRPAPRIKPDRGPLTDMAHRHPHPRHRRPHTAPDTEDTAPPRDRKPRTPIRTCPAEYPKYDADNSGVTRHRSPGHSRRELSTQNSLPSGSARTIQDSSSCPTSACVAPRSRRRVTSPC